MKTHIITFLLALIIPFTLSPILASDVPEAPPAVIEPDIAVEIEALSGNPWTLAAADVTATVYNAVASQCAGNPLITASRYHIIPDKIEEQRILAMERTMMAEYGIAYGDTVIVEGAGIYDGAWQVQDTMNKRFAGQHKIDFLVPSHIRTGKWKNVKVYYQNRKES